MAAVQFPTSPTPGETTPDPDTGAVWAWGGAQWIPATAAAVGAPVPIVLSYPGLPAASSTITVPMVVPLMIPAGAAGSEGHARVNPTASATFEINQNGTSVGTVVIGTNGGVVFNVAAQINLAVDDVLTFVAPATQDTTLANVGVSLFATKA